VIVVVVVAAAAAASVVVVVVVVVVIMSDRTIPHLLFLLACCHWAGVRWISWCWMLLPSISPTEIVFFGK